MCLSAESGTQLFFFLNFNVQSQIGRQSPVTVQAIQQAVFLAIESEELQLVAGRAHGICNFERLG